MSTEWNIIIDDCKEEYRLVRKDHASKEYMFLRKPFGSIGGEKVMEYFISGSDEEAKILGRVWQKSMEFFPET